MADEGEEVEDFQPIEKLQQLGVNQGKPGFSLAGCDTRPLSDCSALSFTSASCAGDIKKAKEAGYHTCEALLMNTRKVCLLQSMRFTRLTGP